jgi:hypothetical protein
MQPLGQTSKHHSQDTHVPGFSSDGMAPSPPGRFGADMAMLAVGHIWAQAPQKMQSFRSKEGLDHDARGILA